MSKKEVSIYFQRGAFILLVLVFFLLSVDLLSNSFRYLGKDIANSFIYATSNPFIALFVGLLITAIIQSSSTSTAMIVAFVASGSITVVDAVPMVMGANIGTTITSTLVSVGFISRKKEFRKAVSAGVIHDFYNIITVSVFFPLEYYYQLLSNAASRIAGLLHLSPEANSIANGYSPFLSTATIVKDILGVFNYPLVLLILSFILLLFSIKVLSKYIYKIISGGSAEAFKKYFFGSSIKSFLWGIFLTIGVLSSSVTTSLIVPFVATGKVKLSKAFHFILGANIGTTITAIIAAIFRSEAALTIAIAHLILNLAGAILFLSLPFLSKAIIEMAKVFSRHTMKRKIIGFAYLLITFFVIPYTLIYFTNEGTEEKSNKIEHLENEHYYDTPSK